MLCDDTQLSESWYMQVSENRQGIPAWFRNGKMGNNLPGLLAAEHW